MKNPNLRLLLVVALLGWPSALPVCSQTLLNIDFGVGSRSAKVGLAATGQATNDYWNLYRHYDPRFLPGTPLVADGRLDNLKLADGSDSKVSVRVTNAPGVWGNATGDPMFDTYIFAQNGSNITVTLTGLEAGRYHFYLYGHADPDVTGEQNSVFTLRAGTNVVGPALSLGGAGWKATQPWQERYQYVVFRDVPVPADTPVIIEVAPGPNGVAVLNGLQISSRGTSPPRLWVAPAPRPVPTLTNLLFHEVRYDGQVSGAEARFTVDLRVESLTTNEISAPLFEGDVAVLAPELPSGLRLTSAAKRYRLVATAPGTYRLQLELLAKITRAEPWNHIAFTGPDAAIAAVQVRAVEPGLDMQLLKGTQVESTTGATPARLSGFLGPDRVVALRWQSRAAEVARRSLVTVDTLATAQISPTVIRFNTRLALDILQAPVPRLTLALPQAQTLTKLHGEQIRDWTLKTEDQRQLLTVEFVRPVEKAYTLTLLTEQPVEAEPRPFTLTPPQPLDVERESGSFSLSADDMTVEIESVAGLRQVNAPPGALAAYRFFSRPASLTARLRRVAPVIKVADRVALRLEEARLLVAHALSLQVEKAGLYALALIPQPGFTVADVRGEGVDDWQLVGGQLRVSFRSRLLGTRLLHVHLEQPLREFPRELTVLPLRVVGASQETALLGASAALGIRLKTAGDLVGLREVPVTALGQAGGSPAPPGAQTVGGASAVLSDEQLAYRADQGDWRLILAAERLPARLVAEVFNLVTVGDGLVGGSATIRYGILHQGVQQFRVKLPAHWKNVEFIGPNIRRKEIQVPAAGAAPETNAVLWTLTLQDKAWGGYTLVITYDYPFDPQRATLDLAGAHCPDAERETGAVALTSAANLKIEPLPATGLVRGIDPGELSETDRALISRPVLLAWHYHGPDFRLGVRAERFAEVPPLEAVADRTQLTSVLTEEGQMLTQASFMVKNHSRQAQQFKLPPGATFWSCLVNRQPAKAEVNGDWLLVPLPRGGAREEAFAVDLVYAQKFAPLNARWFAERLRLQAPTTDVPNTYAEWQVFVPETQHVSGFGGSMTVARGTVYGLREAWDRFTGFYREFFQEYGVGLAAVGGPCLVLLAIFLGAARRGSKGVVAALVGVLILGVLVSMLLPALAKAKARAVRVGAVSHLKQIALAARQWAEDNQGYLPPSLEQLKTQLGSERVLRDPESGEPFVYVGAGKRAGDPHAIVAYSPVDLRGRAVAFADGSVQMLNSAQFNEALQRDAQAAAQFAAAAAQREAVQAAQQLALPAVQAPTPSAPAQAPAGGAEPGAGPSGAGPVAGPLSASARSLPLEIPRIGQPFAFTKVLNIQDEPLTLEMALLKQHWFERRRAAFQLLAFLAGLLVLGREWRRTDPRAWRLTVGLALTLGAVGHLMIAHRTLHWALIAAGPVVVLGLLIVGLRKLWQALPPAAVPAPAGAIGTVAVLALALLTEHARAQVAGGGRDQAEVSSATPAISGVSNAYTFTSASYTGAVAEKVARFDVTLAIATFATNQLVPLFGDDVALEEFTARTSDARLVRQGRWVALRLGEATNTLLHCKLVVPLGGDAGRRHLAFAIPPALSSRFVLTLAEADAEVEFPSAVSFQRQTAGAQTRVEAVLGSGDRVDLTWTPRVKRAAEMAATVFVENTALVTLGAGAVNTRATLTYQVTQGELRQLKVRVPAGERLLRVEGEFIRTWELRPAAAEVGPRPGETQPAAEAGRAVPGVATHEVLLVELVKGVAPTYRLTLETERVLEPLPASVFVALPSALEVIRETGLVGVRGVEEVSLTVGAVADLQQMDGAEFIKASNTSGEGLVSAYRFLKPGFVLRARVEAVQPQIEAVARNAFAIGFEEVRLQAEVDYTIKRAGVFTLQMALPAGFRVDAVTAPERTNAPDARPQPRELQWTDKGDPRVLEVTFKERVVGPLKLAVALTRAHRELPRTVELAGVRPLAVHKLSGFVSITAEPGVAVKTTAFDGLTEVPAAALGLAQPATRGGSVLAFKITAPDPQAAPWRLSLETEAVESWIRAEVANVVTVTDTLLTGRAVVRYDIANAPVKEFRLRVPAAYTNVEVLGPNLRRRDHTNDLWTLELQTKVRGSHTFTVTWEQPRPAQTKAELVLAGVETLGTERETGFMVVLARPPLQVSAPDAGDQLLRLDARELPGWAGVPAGATAGGEAPALVYRYLRPGWTLRVVAERLAEAAVLQALVESAQWTSVLADDGQMMTELSLRLRNQGRQHLEVALPTGAKMWSAFVGGQPVRPTERAGKILVPLERARTGQVPVEVELTYVGSVRFPRVKGTVHLISPQFDVPLKHVLWDLYLPPDYDYADFAGSMTHEAAAAPVVQVFSATEYERQEQAKRQTKISQVRSYLRNTRKGLAEGNVKDANWDFLNALTLNSAVADEEARRELEGLKRDLGKVQGSNLVRAQRAYTAENLARFAASPAQVQGGPGQARTPAPATADWGAYDAETAEQQALALNRAQEVSVAQVQPLRANLPTRGLRHRFSQVLQTEANAPMTISFAARSTREISGVRRVSYAAGGLAGLWLLAAWAARRRSRTAKSSR